MEFDIPEEYTWSVSCCNERHLKGNQDYINRNVDIIDNHDMLDERGNIVINNKDIVVIADMPDITQNDTIEHLTKNT